MLSYAVYIYIHMFLFDALGAFCWDDIIPKKVLQPRKHLYGRMTRIDSIELPNPAVSDKKGTANFSR